MKRNTSDAADAQEYKMSNSTTERPGSGETINVLISLHVFLIVIVTLYFIFKTVDCVFKRKRRSLERSSAYRRFRQPNPSAFGDITPSPTVLGDMTPTISRARDVGNSYPVLPTVHSESSRRREIATHQRNNHSGSPSNPAFHPALPEEEPAPEPFYSSAVSIQSRTAVQPNGDDTTQSTQGPHPSNQGDGSIRRPATRCAQPVPQYRRSVSQGIQTETMRRPIDPSYSTVVFTPPKKTKYTDVVRTVMGSMRKLSTSSVSDLDGPEPRSPIPRPIVLQWPEPTSPGPTSPGPANPGPDQSVRPKISGPPPRPEQPSAAELKRYQKNGLNYTFVDMATKSRSLNDLRGDLDEADYDYVNEDEDEDECPEIPPIQLQPAPHDLTNPSSSLNKRLSFKIVKPAPPVILGNQNNNSSGDLVRVGLEGAVGYSVNPRPNPRSSSMLVTHGAILENDDPAYYNLPAVGSATTPFCRVSSRNRERRLTLYDEVVPVKME